VCAGEAQAHAANLFVPAKVDTLSAAITENALGFIARQLGRIDLDRDALDPKKLIIGEFTIGKHLLAGGALDLGMKLPGKIAGIFKRDNAYALAGRKIDKRGGHLSPVAELQSALTEPTTGDGADGVGGAAIDLNEGNKPLSICAERIGDAQRIKSENSHAHTQNLAGTHMPMRNFGLLQQCFE
jgi:hypothetical protein